MTEHTSGELWLGRAKGYAVYSAQGTVDKPEHRGLSHVEAMRVAEGLARGGKRVTVRHVVGDKTYEVDRYPAR